MAEDSSDSTNRLAIIIANLKLGIDVNPFQPINKINKFRYENIVNLKIYEDLVRNANPLENLYEFFTPNNLFEILDDIKISKKKLDCFMARSVYNLIEKVYIQSWISCVIRYHGPTNYKLMAFGCSTIRSVLRVVIRELISTKTGLRPGFIEDIIDTVGDCNANTAYLRDAEVHKGTCISINNKYANSAKFLDEYTNPYDNCPHINDIMIRKGGFNDTTSDDDPKWLNIIESAIKTNAFHNFFAGAADNVLSFTDAVSRVIGVGANSSPDITPEKYNSKGAPKVKKIVDRILKKKAISKPGGGGGGGGGGGRKTIKRKHNKYKYIKTKFSKKYRK